ncbi:hypothetical protein JI435_412700, partial [Parastagonospora nodorum SN15]
GHSTTMLCQMILNFSLLFYTTSATDPSRHISIMGYLQQGYCCCLTGHDPSSWLMLYSSWLSQYCELWWSMALSWRHFASVSFPLCSILLHLPTSQCPLPSLLRLPPCSCFLSDDGRLFHILRASWSYGADGTKFLTSWMLFRYMPLAK